ncbi:hypothetical protein HGP05_09050 [Streptococcus sanguinis]|uniref:Uncharacterized protein n=1 Tax=Streptococcus sanguinis TaxID=1305 RepID=A0A7Y0VBM0_STRSA|nr:hypothetical protein [Streptococcus sanguinis]
MEVAIAKIQAELEEQLAIFEKEGKLGSPALEAAHGVRYRNAARDGYKWSENYFATWMVEAKESRLIPFWTFSLMTS